MGICIIQSPTQDDINKLPNSISPASNAPIALVFGWAGSKHKNLDKYSKADFYLPWTFLEENVLHNRKGDVRTMRWDKSRHVDHLRKYKQEYTNVLLDFVHT